MRSAREILLNSEGKGKEIHIKIKISIFQNQNYKHPARRNQVIPTRQRQ